MNEFNHRGAWSPGGPNRGSSSFSPRTKWLYIHRQNDAGRSKRSRVGTSLKPGPGAPGHFQNIAEEGKTGVTATQNIAAFDPATGDLAWVTEFPGTTNGGNLVTAGDVVFQAIGREFYTLDATSGKQLSKVTMKTIVSASTTHPISPKGSNTRDNRRWQQHPCLRSAATLIAACVNRAFVRRVAFSGPPTGRLKPDTTYNCDV